MIPESFNETVIVSTGTELSQLNSLDQENFHPSHFTDCSVNLNPSGDDIEPETIKPTSQIKLPPLFSWSRLNSVKLITDLDDYSLLNIFSYINNIREKIRLKRG